MVCTVVGNLKGEGILGVPRFSQILLRGGYLGLSENLGVPFSCFIAFYRDNFSDLTGPSSSSLPPNPSVCIYVLKNDYWKNQGKTFTGGFHPNA
jgi:hypothetical protein